MTHTTIQVFKIYLWNTRNLLNYCETITNGHGGGVFKNIKQLIAILGQMHKPTFYYFKN